MPASVRTGRCLSPAIGCHLTAQQCALPNWLRIQSLPMQPGSPGDRSPLMPPAGLRAVDGVIARLLCFLLGRESWQLRAGELIISRGRTQRPLGARLVAAGAPLRAAGFAFALFGSIAEGRAGDSFAVGVPIDSRVSWVGEAIALQHRCAHRFGTNTLGVVFALRLNAARRLTFKFQPVRLHVHCSGWFPNAPGCPGASVKVSVTLRCRSLWGAGRAGCRFPPVP